MLPASKGMAARTRSYMGYAREAAEQAVEQNPGPYELNFVKTYHESTLKEHMYVTHDFDQAVKAGTALIDLDPVWAPSYGELADAYDKFGHTETAAELFTRAAGFGPPYVGHHLVRAAGCWERSGSHEQALSCYTALAELAPANEDVLQGGLRCARATGHTSAVRFEEELQALNTLVTPEPGRDV